MTNDFKIVFLIGMPGVGKTYFGKYAAQKLGLNFIDLDTEIIKKHKLSIADIFKIKGEVEFRKIELNELKQIVKQCSNDTLIATGGGTPCFNNAIQWMNERGITVWLDAEIDGLYNNIVADIQNRPLFNTIKEEELLKKLVEMNRERLKFYSQGKVKVSVYRGFSADLFTNTLHLSTFAI